MFQNYIKIAWRILLRQKYFSLINILGLAVGMAACLLIVQYLSYEISYDNFYANGSRIYRIKHQNYSQGNLIENMPKTYSAVGPAMKAEFAEVQNMVRVSPGEGLVISAEPGGSMIAFNEHNLYFVDASFLKVFQLPMAEGTVNALANENSVVITEQTAKKYFPNQDALGKTLKIQQQVSGTDVTATVTGICKNVPANSHLRFDFLVSYNLKGGDWVYPDSYTYVLLSPNTTAKVLEAKAIGLFALTAFLAEQRVKEIGIRKVLGASVSAITALLSKDFIKLVALAVIIATPIAWWALSKWLQDFAYRINLSWWLFALAAVITVVITVLTVSAQAKKAALANPVKSLRSE